MDMAAEVVWRFVTVLKADALKGSEVKEIKICLVSCEFYDLWLSGARPK
jgi:hypothetical protein